MENKQSMKLYTEEQILFYLTMHSSAITRYDLHNIPHIELPSDAEIKKESEWLDNPLERLNFQEGIRWMRDKIQGGNK